MKPKLEATYNKLTNEFTFLYNKKKYNLTLDHKLDENYVMQVLRKMIELIKQDNK